MNIRGRLNSLLNLVILNCKSLLIAMGAMFNSSPLVNFKKLIGVNTFEFQNKASLERSRLNVEVVSARQGGAGSERQGRARHGSANKVQ